MIQCSKMVNFDHKEAGLTSKWGRISPAIQWCYQNQSYCILQRCMTSDDVVTPKKIKKILNGLL